MTVLHAVLCLLSGHTWELVHKRDVRASGSLWRRHIVFYQCSRCGKQRKADYREAA